MKTLRYTILTLIAVTIIISCNNFDELNTNPNSSTKVSPQLLATQLLKNTYRFWNPNATDFGTDNLNAKHIAMLDGATNNAQYNYTNYPYGGFGSFQNLTNTKAMVDFAKGGIYENSYKGLSLFLKAWWGYKMTLDMGDIPYSEAGKATEGIFRPKYDKQEDVFVQILKDLEDAEAAFAAGTNFGTSDIMYNGDVTKWRKLCNTMQLKVLMTISKKITATQKARFAAIVNAGNLMTGNADNFELKYNALTNSQHPFYNGTNREIYVSVSKLMVDALRNLNDRRLFYFAEPAPYLIKAGKLENDWTAYEGAPTELSSQQLSLGRANGTADGKYSLINKRYARVQAGDPMIQLSYAEQNFIIAEAVEEGWVSGTAQTYYENGVKAILSYYKNLPSAPSTYLHGMAIDDAYISGYFTGEAAYKTGGTKTERLQQIWMQRYFLDFFQGNALFSYREFLRTGFPQFPLDPATSLNPDDPNQFPKRWKYPPDELTKNPDNYQKAITDQYAGYDGINKLPWWLQ